MRTVFTKTAHRDTLLDVLRRIGPAALGAYLAEGPGFRVRFTGTPSSIIRTPGTLLRYELQDTGLSAKATIKVAPGLGAMSYQIILTNASDEPSPPIRDLNPFYLPLNLATNDRPSAIGFGGGLTDGFYPPRAYREERVCFGKARRMPPDPTFTRWWVAQQVYTLSTDDRGLSSAPHLPLMLASWPIEDGEIGLWAAMEWSGRWQIRFGATQMQSWRFVFQGGPLVRDVVLEPGERICLPRVHLGVWGGPGATVEDGLNSIRRYVAQALAPDVEGRRPWPFIAYHHWFGIEEQLDEGLLRAQVDRAAELGIEYFEVDAGWYGGASDNFADGVGNWERVEKKKFPQGLEPLAAYVRAKGLRFGLWFEPERGREGSDWVTQHPDWYWHLGDSPNYHLDLTRREIQDALIDVLSTWIERLDIRWLRWDYNLSPGSYWDAVDPTGKVQFAYVEGLYRVRDALLKRYPNLLIDNCASGGRRTDFGTLRRAGTTVISDHAEDPHICRLMQTGAARVLPANYVNSSFYVGPRDGDDHTGPLELMSRMAGCLSFSGHIANWSADQVTLVRRYLDGYRAFRHLLMGDFYPLTPYPRSQADWDVVQFLDPDTAEAIVLAYRMRGNEIRRTVFPVRLDTTAHYRAVDPFAATSSAHRDGQDLMVNGLHVTLQPESACVLYLQPGD